ncbi:MAG: type I-F CRISPR-associated endoribonuclease Cas6/Csy4 [Sphaerochaetaceae bacterium]
MKYYLELTILPSSEINGNFLLSKVFQKIHFLFVNQKEEDGLSNVGISFPEYNKESLGLGSKIRFFAETSERLEALKLKEVLGIFKDYIYITKVRTVPNQTKYCCFSRKQKKTGIFALAKRKAKRKEIEFERALKDYQSFEPDLLKLPFVNMLSSSSNQQYKLFIQKKESEEVGGKFNTYGLSFHSTVPDF